MDTKPLSNSRTSKQERGRRKVVILIMIVVMVVMLLTMIVMAVVMVVLVMRNFTRLNANNCQVMEKGVGRPSRHDLEKEVMMIKISMMTIIMRL